MPARAPIWEGTKITLIYKDRIKRAGGFEYTYRDGNTIQCEKFEARGGSTISAVGGEGALTERVRFKIRIYGLPASAVKPARIREANGAEWEVEAVSTPTPDMRGNRGARNILFIECVRVGDK